MDGIFDSLKRKAKINKIEEVKKPIEHIEEKIVETEKEIKPVETKKARKKMFNRKRK